MENKIFDIVLFHYPCQDGLASGWVVDYYHKINNTSIELYPIQHNRSIDMNRLENKSVVFCDYSPTIENLEKIEKITKNITILDHHISAKNALVNKPYAIFNMEKSGAGLTWEYFFPDIPIPNFLQMIQDRDLWTWKLSDSRPFTAGFFTVCSSYESDDFDNMFKLFDDLYSNKEKINFYLELGGIMNKVNLIKARDMSDKHSKKVNQYSGYNVCIVNCSSDLASDVGNMLSSMDHIDFAVLWTYYHPSETFNVSLRSSNKVDVSLIAKQFNGGGHVNAAGFATKINPMEIFKTN